MLYYRVFMQKLPTSGNLKSKYKHIVAYSSEYYTVGLIVPSPGLLLIVNR